MFERYTEQARRSIFFARFEASRCGTDNIEVLHLLAGVLKERSPESARILPDELADSILAELLASPATVVRQSTSVDLPLSRECKQVLAAAASTAKNLGDPHIGTEHLLMALLETETAARKFLAERGVSTADLDRKRQAITRADLHALVDILPEAAFPQAEHALRRWQIWPPTNPRKSRD